MLLAFLVKRSLRAGHNTAILKRYMAQQHSWCLTLRKCHFFLDTNIYRYWAKTKCKTCLINKLYVCLWQGRYKRRNVCFRHSKMMSNGKKYLNQLKSKELKRHYIVLHNLVKHNFKSQLTVAQGHSSHSKLHYDHCLTMAFLAPNERQWLSAESNTSAKLLTDGFLKFTSCHII